MLLHFCISILAFLLILILIVLLSCCRECRLYDFLLLLILEFVFVCVCVFWHKCVYMWSKVNFKIYGYLKRTCILFIGCKLANLSIKLNYDIQITYISPFSFNFQEGSIKIIHYEPVTSCVSNSFYLNF